MLPAQAKRCKRKQRLHTWRCYSGGDAVCGATQKPLHLHNPSTSLGNMEVAYRLENVIYCIFIACLVLAHGPRNRP